jgi:tripartite-type tricarboxylate transporter receptor subunit TctC
MVPAATPDTVVETIGAEVLRIMASPEIEERARMQGFRIDARGPREFGSFLNAEVDRWARVIAAGRITAE